ncbi:MAG: DNA polymerase III subunit gamma/tau [Bacteroidales bacterium]|nr:DNA polymerase III subunit gamma/tau [Bacteroidales bacterium]
MESYIVSARKYRPATFESVVGQEHITNTLKNAIKKGQLAQAFLFCGPRGVGKTTCARILAKAINCEHLSETTEACNECESCRSFNESASMNIFELDAASNNSVDDIRRLVEQVRIPPQSGRYKVYIIDEVHMLTLSAFNAFLKTLEEPPAYAKFILATTEKHKIIPTILSRCQIFDFKRIRTEDISKHLEYVATTENISYEPEALHIVAQKAEGGLRDALSMFDQLVNFTGGNLTYANCIDNLNVLDYEYYFKLIDYFRSGDISNSLLLYQQVLGKGFDGQHFITGLSEHLRNLLVCLDPITHTLLDVTDNIKQKYLEQAANCKLPLLIKYLEISSDYEYRYREANNKRLFIEVALTKLASVMRGDLQNFKSVPNATQPVSAPQPVKAVPSTSAEDTTKAISSETQQPTTSVVQSTDTTTQENSAKTLVQIKVPVKTSTISINVDNANVQDAKTEDEVEEAGITKEIIDEFWEEYSTTTKNENLKFAMIHSDITVRSSNFFNIEFENSYSESIIRSSKMELLTYLREKTGVKLLNFSTSVIQQETRKKLYSANDKFDYMRTKNPQILNYRKVFKEIEI